MTTFMTFTILGLVLGSVYAIAASGLVLTYNTSGIFNFAHGAQAMIGAFLFWQLRYGWELPTLVSVVIVLGLVGPLMGFGLHWVIMRGLRDTAEVTKIVVTVAVLLGFVSLSHWLWSPDEARVLDMFFGATAEIRMGDVVVSYHEILCIVAAIVIAIGLRMLFTRSRTGVVMRAVVDDPDLLRLNGHDPDRIAGLSWALGSTLAVLAGILITPVGGGALSADALTLLVIDAFAAAMFGRLRSIPRTFVGAMVLGLSGTYLVAYAPTEPWVNNLRVALPMIILFVVLVLLPQDRLRSAAVRTRERYRAPSVRQAAVWGVVLVVVVLAVRQLIDSSSVGGLLTGLAFAVIALSLTLLTGYAGEINLAPVSLGAVSTIVAFHFGMSGEGLETRMSIGGLVLGVLAATVVGALVALPALRLRGLYLALATMAFGVFVSTMVLRDTTEHELFGRTFTVFPNGMLVVPALKVGPLDLNDQDVALVVYASVFSVLAVGVVALRNSGYGRRLAAMKDSPAAAAMLGQRLVWLKLSVFTISSAIAGLGGVMMSMALTTVSSDTFLITISLSVVMLTVVGGIGYVSGALFGGLMAGLGFTLTGGAFNDLSISYPDYEATFSLASHLIMVGIALVGIGVAKNPSGFVHDIFHGYRRALPARPVLYGALAVQVVLYGVAYADVINTWLFSVLSLVLWGAYPALAERFMPRAVLTPAELEEHQAPPMELVGIDTPYPEGMAASLDRSLGLPPRARVVLASHELHPEHGPHPLDPAREEISHVPV
ncbi:branched-chain amino acid ABC transporter permease [Nocardioides pacificus]